MWDNAVAAGIAVAGSLGAVVLTNRHNRRMADESAKALDQQRAHDQAARDADRREAHGARLLADRLAAYRAFNASRVRYRRAYEDQSAWWGKTRQAIRDGNITEGDEAHKRWIEGLGETTAAAEALEESIQHIALVASRPVREAAETTKSALDEVARLEFRFSDNTGEAEVAAFFELREARVRLEDAQREMRDAINRELNVDA